MASGSSASVKPTLARAVKCVSPKYTASAPASIAACNCGQWPTGLRTSGRITWGALLLVLRKLETMAASETNLDEYRSEFPITRHLTWMSHAAIAPLVKPAAEAMIRLSEQSLNFSSLHDQAWMETNEA